MSETSYLTMVSFRRLLEISGIRNYYDNAETRHRMAMSLFGQDAGVNPRSGLGVIFRAERSGSKSFMLIRSQVPPANIPGVESLKEDFDTFSSGNAIRFRLSVSPIIRKDKKERFINDYDELESWIATKLQDSMESISLVGIKDESVRRGRSKNFVKLVQVDGVATVKDSIMLKQILEGGVGRNKSYGAGLLTVAKI